MLFIRLFHSLSRPFIVAVLMGLALMPAQAQPFETKAKQAFMIDAELGHYPFSKDADKPIPPASLAKLMTMETVFHAIKAGRLSLEDTFQVSESSWRTVAPHPAVRPCSQH